MNRLSDLAYDKFEYTEAFNEMVNSLYKATLVSIYSLLEKQMHQLCDELQRETGELLSYAEMNPRNYLIDGLTYLKKVIKLPFDTLEPYYNTLSDLQHIRNYIVHDKADPDKIDKGVRSVVDKSTGRLSYDETTGQLTIQRFEYLTTVCDHIRQMMREVMHAVQVKMNYPLIKRSLASLLSDPQMSFSDVTRVKKEFHLTGTFSGKGKLDAGVVIEMAVRCNVRYHYGVKNQLVSEASNVLQFVDFVKSIPAEIWADVLQFYTNDPSRVAIYVTLREK